MEEGKSQRRNPSEVLQSGHWDMGVRIEWGAEAGEKAAREVFLLL